MTDEERQRTMDFILAQQAKFSADMQKLEESQKRADDRMDRGFLRTDRLERVLKLMIRAGQRARKQMREQDVKFERRFIEISEMIASLGQAQAHSDRRLDALIDIVREQRNGNA